MGVLLHVYESSCSCSLGEEKQVREVFANNNYNIFTKQLNQEMATKRNGMLCIMYLEGTSHHHCCVPCCVVGCWSVLRTSFNTVCHENAS